MHLQRLLLFSFLLLSLSYCDPAVEPASTTAELSNAVNNVTADEFAASFRMRNSEIRDDIIAELTKRNIPHKLNADGSIGYRAADGEAIDAVYYWAVGLYAARN